MPVQTEQQGAAAVLTLDRPEAHNALSDELLADLEAGVQALEGDDSVRCLVITGAGDRAFCAGADVGLLQAADAAEAHRFARRGQALMRRLERGARPVVAAVNGVALGGGCELALACDIRVASERALFGQPEVGLGVPPGWGATQRLARVVGAGVAREMILTGSPIDAGTALRVGLVTHVVDPGELIDRALELADAVASQGPEALATAKQLCNLAHGTDFDEALEHEAARFALAFTSPERSEGVGAFLEKRRPAFSRAERT